MRKIRLPDRKRIIAGVVLLAAVGGLVALSPLGLGVLGGASATGNGPIEAGAGPYPQYRLKDRVLNLADRGPSGDYQYVKLGIAIEYVGRGTKKYSEAAPEERDAIAKDLNKKLEALYSLKLHDVLTSILSGKKAEEVRGASGQERLRSEIANKFNQALAPDYQVVKVLIVDIAVQ